MFEVFLSPQLTTHEKTMASTLLKDICEDSVIVQKISPTIGLRVVTRHELIFITKQNCLIVTPLCLKHMKIKQINPGLFQTEWKSYINLFLFRKKIAFLNISEEKVKKYTDMVRCMGGKVVFLINSKVDYVITDKPSQIVLSHSHPPMIKPEWLDSLFYETNYIKPSNYLIETSLSKKTPTVKRKGPLKSPIAEIKSIKDPNPGFQLRKREKLKDIQMFFNPKNGANTNTNSSSIDKFDDLKLFSSDSENTPPSNSLPPHSTKLSTNTSTSTSIQTSASVSSRTSSGNSTLNYSLSHPTKKRVPLIEKQNDNQIISSSSNMTKTCSYHSSKNTEKKLQKIFEELSSTSSDIDDDDDFLCSLDSNKGHSKPKDSITGCCQNILRMQSLPLKKVSMIKDEGLYEKLSTFSQAIPHSQYENKIIMGYDETNEIKIPNYVDEDPLLSLL
ncbi:hypothetical protein TRFO_20535 [Tritrichomonas foetus]|uniref:BRCT domain-containing protein n=1 Tax=Tritrichomonas foetus TaxID=1144522 RepID=A0A1J4KGP9_9EUKA|nr:hypothetical protein TRFO_20535 [Tritrichomonas foetus]|eukprot:OHT10234.1 hypothetical protein TRFO_20535 [Tritrichomonas foetus]